MFLVPSATFIELQNLRYEFIGIRYAMPPVPPEGPRIGTITTAKSARSSLTFCTVVERDHLPRQVDSAASEG